MSSNGSRRQGTASTSTSNANAPKTPSISGSTRTNTRTSVGLTSVTSAGPTCPWPKNGRPITTGPGRGVACTMDRRAMGSDANDPVKGGIRTRKRRGKRSGTKRRRGNSRLIRDLPTRLRPNPSPGSASTGPLPLQPSRTLKAEARSPTSPISHPPCARFSRTTRTRTRRSGTVESRALGRARDPQRLLNPSSVRVFFPNLPFSRLNMRSQPDRPRSPGPT